MMYNLIVCYAATTSNIFRVDNLERVVFSFRIILACFYGAVCCVLLILFVYFIYHQHNNCLNHHWQNTHFIINQTTTIEASHRITSSLQHLSLLKVLFCVLFGCCFTSGCFFWVATCCLCVLARRNQRRTAYTWRKRLHLPLSPLPSSISS